MRVEARGENMSDGPSDARREMEEGGWTIEGRASGSSPAPCSAKPDEKRTAGSLHRAGYTCEWCGSTGQVLYVPVTAGKMSGTRNCQRCNRNGRRINRKTSTYNDRTELVRRPVVALGYQAPDGTIVVTDVLCMNFPDMTNEEMAALSWKLDQWSREARR